MPDHQIAENPILVSSLQERTKKDKSKFATESAGIIVTITCKNISQIASKTFTTQFFHLSLES